MRNQERSAVQREEQLNVLYDVTGRFASSRSIDEAIEYVLAYIKSTFEALAVVYINPPTVRFPRRRIRQAQ